MAKVNAPIFSVNGGEVGDEGLARLDLERMQFAGSRYFNMLPRVIGSMTLRPGLEHVTDIDFGNVALLEYSYSGGSSLVPVLSDEILRVVKDNAVISRTAVSTEIENGEFTSFTGWTDSSTGGTATATASGGFLYLQGTTQDTGSATQTIPVAIDDRGVEHGLRISVIRGPVKVRLGSTSGETDLISADNLDDGVHSIAFTPTTANIYLEIYNEEPRVSVVDRVVIDEQGQLRLPTPWTSADLSDNIVRYTQHKDILYTASGVYQQREIHRRGDTSWGVQRYKVDDGPFVSSDDDTNISLSPSRLQDNGSVTLTASRYFFEEGMINRLFRIYQSGQTVYEAFTADPAEGDYIRISGVDSARKFEYEVSGTWSGTVRLQIAVEDGSGNPTSWTTVRTFTSNVSSTYYDTDDNVIKFARFALDSSDLTSGTISTQLTYPGGSNYGICRMTGYVSRTVANIEILSRFYSRKASFEWDYSIWSNYDGWPAAVEKFGGRLYWGHGDFVYGSVPDNYKSHDDQVEGDSAPIARSIGASTDRGILWMIGIQRLIAGTDSGEVSIKSSSLDEPLTTAAWFPVETSNRGCTSLRPLRCDRDGVFVQTTGTSVFALVNDSGSLDYISRDLMELHEEICDGSEIVDLAIQRKPDTVLWFILANGSARALTYEPDEKVVAWSRIATDGQIKRVCANRGAGDDNIYFAVVRNGTQRLEKLAKHTECRGGALNCLADGFSRFVAAAGQTTFSVPHLNGLDVTVWAGGTAIRDQDNLYTVSGGNVVIAAQEEGTPVVIGLPYVGEYRSTKLAYGAQGGTALFQPKKVSALGLYLTNTSPNKLLAGKGFQSLRPVGETEKGRLLDGGEVVEAYEADMTIISSDWDTDSRVCIRANTPYPATVAAMVLDVKTNG